MVAVWRPLCKALGLPVASRGSAGLDGVKVLDAATLFAGPIAAAILGDYGAEVIKLEHPRGDGSRSHGRSKDGHSLWWKVVGRNKLAATLNLSTEEGQELLRRLVQQSDVLIESFRPGTLEKWGLGWQELSRLNPKLVMLRVSGFGQTGPYSARPGFGTLAEAMSGFAHVTGDPAGPPTLPPFGLADAVTGIAGALAVMTALYQRDVGGGTGDQIDLAVIDPILHLLGIQPTEYDQLGLVQGRSGNRSVNNAPRNLYQTADQRWVAVSTSATSIAERLMILVGRPELVGEPWFRTGAGRVGHADELDASVAMWVNQHTAEEVVDACERAGAAVAVVNDIAAATADPQYLARGSFVRVPDPDLGPILMQNVLFRMASGRGEVRFPGRRLGSDNDLVYGERLGLPPDELARLRTEGVI